MIKEITHFVFICTPMSSFPIRSVTMNIIANNREEADELFYRHAHEFFDQNLRLVVEEVKQGYQYVPAEEKSNG